MSSETNQEAVVAPEENEPEQPTTEKFELSKDEYNELVGYKATVGSLKRQLKDLQKPKEETKETPQPDSSALLQKTYLRAAGITQAEEVELALTTAKKWGVDIDQLVDDDDFKSKLEKLRTAKANTAASSNIQGSGKTEGAKFSAEHWIAKGTPPTRDQVPDRKTRANIVRSMMESAKTGGKKFYND